VRERWLSRRAVFLHLGCLLFVPFCVVAAWWQITRAEDGNGLSYLYTFEWPVFALLGIYFWWQFLHTDYDTVGLKGLRNQAGANGKTPDETGGKSDPDPGSAPDSTRAIRALSTTQIPGRAYANAANESPGQSRPQVQFEEDPELAAYNARLAALASRGGKTWRRPEAHVVRRPQ
jgi:hypothetical protein